MVCLCEQWCACVPLDKSVCAPPFVAGLMAALMHVRQRSPCHRCALGGLKTGSAQTSAVILCSHNGGGGGGACIKLLTAAAKKKRKRTQTKALVYSDPLPSRFSLSSDLTFTVITLLQCSDRISKYVEHTC